MGWPHTLLEIDTTPLSGSELDLAPLALVLLIHVPTRELAHNCSVRKFLAARPQCAIRDCTISKVANARAVRRRLTAIGKMIGRTNDPLTAWAQISTIRGIVVHSSLSNSASPALPRREEPARFHTSVHADT